MKKNSENAKFGWKKIRIKWNLDLCNRNICVLLEHQSKGKMSIYLAATRLLPMFTPILMLFFKLKEDIEGQRYNINDNQIPINVLYAFVMSSTLYPLDNQ